MPDGTDAAFSADDRRGREPRAMRAHFGENLRAQRARVGLSQERLGFACNLHRTEISLLERGEREPRLSTIVRLARALDVPPGALLDGIS